MINISIEALIALIAFSAGTGYKIAKDIYKEKSNRPRQEIDYFLKKLLISEQPSLYGGSL